MALQNKDEASGSVAEMVEIYNALNAQDQAAIRNFGRARLQRYPKAQPNLTLFTFYFNAEGFKGAGEVQ